MAYALVGSLGTVNATAANTANTPSYGQTPTAGNLLVLFVGGYVADTLPATPSGWSVAKQVQEASGTQPCSASIFYKIAAGTDAQPTLAASTTPNWVAQLGEFSGNAATSPLDQSASAVGTGANFAATLTTGGEDAALGELVVFIDAGNGGHCTAITPSSANNGMSFTQSTSITNGFGIGYATTTGNGSADSVVVTQTNSGTGTRSIAAALASFKLAGGGRHSSLRSTPTLVKQSFAHPHGPSVSLDFLSPSEV